MITADMIREMKGKERRGEGAASVQTGGI